MCNKLSRRQFLGQASCAAIGGTTLLSSILNLGAINTLAARPHIIGSGDYKAMVCILLSGGADSFNFLVPTETSEYADYLASRGNLALDKDATDPPELLDLTYDDNGRTFAVNAAMAPVRDLFNDGDLSFVANIGTLIEPIQSISEYESGLKKIPLGLYSHSDQVMHWQTSVPQSRGAVGFAGRIADMFQDMNSIPEISMNISLAGKNRFQSGQQYNEYSIGRNDTEASLGFAGFPTWWSNSGYANLAKNNAIDSLAEAEYINVFEKTIGGLTSQTSESNDIFKIAMQKLSPLTTSFSDTNLSNDLKKVAEIISIQQELGANRQIFFVNYGGWDHHADLKTRQSDMLPILADAMSEFSAAMTEIGMNEKVVTFTASDFARTLTTNGSGSDHAWGGNNMIMGGPVNGGQILGEYPSLSLDGDYNLSSRGRLLPTTSVDEFYAELALWYGASPNDLDYILPNLCNFYSSSGCTTPIPSDYAPIGLFS